MRYRPVPFRIPQCVMTFARRTRHVIRLAIFLTTASAAALANQPSTLVSGPKMPMCYCHCDHAGAKQCTKMCELPQYQDRWWATSCHKKSAVVEPTAPKDSKSNSRKTNRTEHAQR
jgi:hypothetical protein